MQIHKLLSKDAIAVGFEAGGKEDVISRIVDLVATHHAISDIEKVRDAVLDRERSMSTGVGNGIALPHAKSGAISETVAALAILDSPISFDSIDEQPVQIIFLLVGAPESQSEHIRILSRISRILTSDSLTSELLAAASSGEALELLMQEESNLSHLN
jgi:fructose PTS system EIIA component